MKGIINSIGSTVESLGNALDKNITNKEELQAKVNELRLGLANAEKEVRLADANGNWMQRSWRPIVGFVFALILVYNFVFANVLHLPKTELTPEYWRTFTTILGVIGFTRGVEKSIKVANGFIKKRRNERKD